MAVDLGKEEQTGKKEEDREKEDPRKHLSGRRILQGVQPAISIQSVCGTPTEDSYLLWHSWLHKVLRELRIPLMKLSELASRKKNYQFFFTIIE